MVREDVRRHLALCAVLVLAAGLRVPGLDYGLPELYGEATPMRRAWEMWGWEGRGFDLNPHFFHYPALTFYVHLLGQAIAYGIGRLTGAFASVGDMYVLYQQDPTFIVLLGRGINVGFGLAAVALVARLGRLLWGDAVGLAAAAVLAALPEHVSSSRIIAVDTPLTAFTVLALIGACRVHESGGMRQALWCGLWVGLAASCKYTGALLAVPFLAAYLLQAHRRGISPLRALASAQPWAAGGVALVAFLLTSPFCLLDAGTFWQHFSYERFHMARGHFGIDPAAAPVTYARELWRNFGILLMPFLLLGAGARVARLKQDLRWVPLLVFCLGYLVLISTWSMQAPHYLMPALPGLALFAAAGVWDLREGITQRVALPRWASPGLLVILLIVPMAWSAARNVRATSGPDTRALARQWIQTHVPKGSLIAREHYTPELPEAYAAGTVPMLTVTPEFTAPYYDLRWYADFDYFLSSTGVARRYLADPTRFPDHVAFYTDLETRWQLAVRFAPGPAAGPEVLIYRNPDRASRRPDDLLDPDLYRKLGRFSTDYDRQFLGQMGSLFGRKGWYAKARDVCTWQLRVDPQNPVDALTRLGYFDYMRRNYEGAIDAWELAVGADSAEAKVHANLGAAYYRTGDTPRAVAILEKGLRDVPDDPEIPRNLAAIYWELKGPRASVEVLERVLPRFSVNAEFHETLAASHVALGDTTEGIQYYEEAIRLAPGREDLKARLEAICPSP